MDWLLFIGIGFLVIGALYWVIQQRPASPLLHDSALVELYLALEEIHDNSSSQPTMTHTKSGLLLSYFYQYDNAHTPIHLHNISLTIPRGQEKVLRWNDTTQRQITHFIVNTFDQNKVHTVLRSKQGILLINFLFTDDEQHERFRNIAFSEPSDLSSLLKKNAKFELEDVPQNMETLLQDTEEQLEKPDAIDTTSEDSPAIDTIDDESTANTPETSDDKNILDDEEVSAVENSNLSTPT
jgi:hypothetical protein